MLLKELLSITCLNEKIKLEAINGKRYKRLVAEFKLTMEEIPEVAALIENRILHIYIKDNTLVILVKE